MRRMVVELVALLIASMAVAYLSPMLLLMSGWWGAGGALLVAAWALWFASFFWRNARQEGE